MKICHVTSAHNRYDGRIFLKQLTSLSKKYECFLICSDELASEVKNNIKIISTHKKFKNRYERFFKASKYLKKKCLEVNADIYEFHDSELLDLAFYMKKKGKKVIFDAHEDYEALFLERDWIPNFLRYILLNNYIRKEKKILPKLDYLIAAASHIKEKLEVYNKKVLVIENFPILTLKPKKVKHDIETICFAGGINSSWNHDKVIKAISNISNIKYLIAGNYSNEYYASLKELEGFSKTEFLGKLSFQEVRDLYQKSDIGIAICSYRPNMNYKKGSFGNTKILEYMMYELPVIFTDFEIFEEINKKTKFGISVNPTDELQIKEAIEYLIKNREEALKMGKNGRKLVEEKYNWNVLEEKLLNLYAEIEGEL